MKTEHDSLFTEANELWYLDGKTKKALDIYQQMEKAGKTDAAFLYQMGRVHWSLEEHEKADQYFDQAREHINALCEEGQEDLLDMLQSQENEQPFKRELSLDKSQWDVDALQNVELTSKEWLKLAYAFKERELKAIAIFALEQSQKDFVDTSSEWDKKRWFDDAYNMITILEEMQCK
ncbi:MAG: hypothetical protein AAFX87_13570 [Bacteroidota bacterium]